MAQNKFVWRVYCLTELIYRSTISDTEPTVCPFDGQPIDTNATAILTNNFEEILTESYINIESTLADNTAITINASNTNGGLFVNAGIGGILVQTTNAIQLNAAAASNFTTTNGNLILRAIAGLLNIDGGSGINIGNHSATTPILIGTAANAKAITIGNTTSTSSIQMYSGSGNINLDATQGALVLSGGSGNVAINAYNGGVIALGTWNGGDMYLGTAAIARNIYLGNSTGSTLLQLLTGTGGFTVDTTSGGPISLDAIGASSNFTLTSTANSQNLTIALLGSYASRLVLSSAGTGSDSIFINSVGGTTVSATGAITMVSGDTTTNAISLSTSGNNGGINIAAGSQHLIMNVYNGGVIGIGSWNGGDIYFGTAAVARTISIGNTTGTTSVTVSSGTGGIVIGNDANTGQVQIANVASAKTVIIGNNTSTSQLITRNGTGGKICSQGDITSLSDSNQTVTIANLLTGILSGTPTANRTITLPTAANVVAGISNCIVNDSINFSIINNSSNANAANLVVAMGTGGTSVGNMTTNSSSNLLNTWFTSGSGSYKLRVTDIGSGTEAYTVYRLT